MTCSLVHFGQGASPAAAFRPIDLGGVVLWLRADLGFSAGRWADQSSTGLVFTQASAPAQPTLTASSVNGQPGIHFDSTVPQSLVAPHNAALNLAAFTIYLVLNPSTVPATYASPIEKADGSGSSGWGCYYGSGWLIWSGGFTTAGNAGTIAGPGGIVVRGDFSGSTIAGYLDGVAGTSNPAVENDNALSISLGNLSGFGPYPGDILEIIMVNRLLSGADKAKMSAYTTARYGIAA